MFGKPKPPPPSEPRCKWCSSRIGQVEHAPIPLCSLCFTGAAKDRTPFQPKWRQLCEEFRREFLAYRASMTKGNRPSAADSITTTSEAALAMQELAKAISEASKRNDHAKVARLSQEVRNRMDSLADYRRNMPITLAQLEREDGDQ